MKFLTPLLSACILAGALAVAANAQAPCDFSSIAEYNRYESDGQWTVYIVPKNIKRQCLISFTQKIYTDMPGARFEFFHGKGPELDQYIRSAVNGLNDSHPYPEAWMRQHHLATLYVFTTGRGPSDCDWKLTFEKGDDVLIGRRPCKTDFGPPRTCTLTVDQAPKIRGFRLGQTRNEMVDMINSDSRGRLSYPDDIGFVEQSLTPSQFLDRSAFKDVQAVRLTYLEKQLWSIITIYDSETHWQSNLHFTSAVADSLGLPTKGWMGKNPSQLNCDGFMVVTYLASELLPSLMIAKTGLEEEKAARREARERQKRLEFKP